VQPAHTDREHGVYRDLLGAYALGAVPPVEQRAVALHLVRCAACRTELTRLRAAVQALPLALEDREPSPTLRDGIRAAVLRDSDGADRPQAKHVTTPVAWSGSRADRRFGTPWVAVAVLLLAFSLGMLAWNLRLQQALGEEKAAATIALRPVRLAAVGGGGLAYLKDGEVMVVTVRGLPPLSSGLIYELWPICHDALVSASPTARSRAESNEAGGIRFGVPCTPQPIGPGATPVLSNGTPGS
jgi:hypothetical protein